MANTHLSGGAVMGHNLPLLLFLSLEAWFSSASGQNTCGQFSYHRHQGLDDKTFTQDALLVKVYTAEKALTECSSDCFRHPSCNMFVLNPTSGECRRFKRAFFDLTHAISAPGFKYYAAEAETLYQEAPYTVFFGGEAKITRLIAQDRPPFALFVDCIPFTATDCLLFKSSVCQDGFSLYPGTGPADSHCFSAGVWVQHSGSSHVCKQDEWIDTTEDSIPLPAPIVPGVIIDIRGSKSSNGDLLTALRQPSSDPETILLRVLPDARATFGVYSGSGWEGYHTIDPFPVAPDVVFDLQVVVTETQFQIKLDGGVLTSVDVFLPLNMSTLIQMFEWQTVEHVKLTYP